MTKPYASDESRWRHELSDGLAALGLVLGPDQQELLTRYLGLLAKWNRAYNLTAVRDPSRVVARHLLDSLSILPFVQGPRVLDVGTGAGLPGIPLAVTRPAWSFVLLDSNGKKTRFVRQAKLELTLGNVEVVQARVERYRCDPLFDSIVSRAFARLGDMVDMTAHLLRPAGRWVAMKGPAESEERSALPAGIEASAYRVRVPGIAAERRVTVLTRI